MDKDKQIEILEKRVKWLERKVGQLEYENHVQDEEYMSLGGTLNNERQKYSELEKKYAKMEEENTRLQDKCYISRKAVVTDVLTKNSHGNKTD